MSDNTLLSELATRLSSHPENVATEALCYLLGQAGCRSAMKTFLATTGQDLPDNLSYRTQAWSKDTAIPDLVGCNSEGMERLIIEAKFWAGLTPNQPVTYLKRLPEDGLGILLVLAPSLRLPTLWDKLANRCTEADLTLDPPVEAGPEFRYSRRGPNHVLALVSWRAVLAEFGRSAEQAGMSALLSDIDQLRGLCERMDGEAFLPLTDADLAPAFGRRIQQFADLVDATVAELVSNHGVDTKGLTTGGKQATYGRYFITNGIALFLGLSPSYWARYGETPLWVQVYERIPEKSWTASDRIREKLKRLYSDRPSFLMELEGQCNVAIDLPIGVDQQDVIESIIEQIKRIAETCGVEQAHE